MVRSTKDSVPRRPRDANSPSSPSARSIAYSSARSEAIQNSATPFGTAERPDHCGSAGGSRGCSLTWFEYPASRPAGLDAVRTRTVSWSSLQSARGVLSTIRFPGSLLASSVGPRVLTWRRYSSIVSGASGFENPGTSTAQRSKPPIWRASVPSVVSSGQVHSTRISPAICDAAKSLTEPGMRSRGGSGSPTDPHPPRLTASAVTAQARPPDCLRRSTVGIGQRM